MKTASATIVHRMASCWRLGAKRYYDNHLLSSAVILPSAIAMLLVGPEGTGKFYIAKRVASVLFDHCDQSLWSGNSSELMRQPILEIFAEDYFGSSSIGEDDIDPVEGLEGLDPLKPMMIDHLKKREGFGSAIILHHIEHLPISLLSDISEVLSGKTNILSYTSRDGEVVEAVCDGTLFLFTSKDWGTRSILREVQIHGGIDRSSRDSVISSIRHEVGKTTGNEFERVS